jgi:hypothetical protein
MRIKAWAVAAFIAATLAWLPAGAVNDYAPVEPQPAEATLKPGLAVGYVRLMTRTVEDVQEETDFEAGPPLAGLDYHTGSDNVLTSRWNDGVGARITGFIKLPEAGRYLLAMESNDGVRVYLNDKQIINDPGVHSDQFSPNAEVNASAPGWYALKIFYFERKSTSTLRMYWQRPGTDKFEIVPAEQFAYSGS